MFILGIGVLISNVFLCFSSDLNFPYNSYNISNILESTIEKFPFVVALFDEEKRYICTGSIVGKEWVLTSAECGANKPEYIIGGAAVLNRYTANAIRVGFIFTHPNSLHVIDLANNLRTKIRHNVALIRATDAVLEEFLGYVKLSSMLMSKLFDKEVEQVGFGQHNQIWGIHTRRYVLGNCFNSAFQYCACGVESRRTTEDVRMGKGGPIIYKTELVGVAVLASSTNGTNNVFTIINVYEPWIVATMNENRTNLIKRSVNVNELASGRVNQSNALAIFVMWALLFFDVLQV